jgi:hypothetical protein
MRVTPISSSRSNTATCCKAARNSSPVWKRSPGGFASARIMMALNSSGTTGSMAPGGGGGCSTCARMSEYSLSPSNGFLPVAIWYSTTPTE